MAHHKSALKRIRQTRRRRIYNRLNKKALKTAVRAVREATTYDTALEKLKVAYRVYDLATSRHIVHKNNAANHKSALSAFVKSLKKSA